MLRSQGNLLAWSFLIILFLFVAVGCKKTSVDEGTNIFTSDNVSNTQPGSGLENLGMTIGYDESPKYTYKVHEGLTDFSSPCKVTSSSSDKDILCILEANELDLYYHGVSLHYNVPPSLCSYVTWNPYYYYGLPAGRGPDYISIQVKDGAINGSPTVKYGGAGGIDVSSMVEWSGTSPACASNGGYVHSIISGPSSTTTVDCCYGSYSMWVSNWDTNLNNYAPAIESKLNWPGLATNCLSGPAVVTQPKNKNGFPMGSTLYVEGEGINKQYQIAPPINGLLKNLVYAANFFSGAAPKALKNPLLPNGSYDSDVPGGMPFYVLSCYDRAEEHIASITLMIRKWDEVKEFNKGVTGNPSSGFPLTTDPITGEYLDDYWGWNYIDSLPAPFPGEIVKSISNKNN